MKKLRFLIWLHVSRMTKRPSFLAALFLPAVLLLLMGLLLPREQETTLYVGIYVEEESPLAEDFYETLLAVETAPVAFVRAESRTQLEEMVAAAVWECGYVLPADFSRRVEEYALTEIFTRVTSPATSMQALSNVAVQAALLELIGDDVAAQYLNGLNIMEREDFFALIERGKIRTTDFYATFDVEVLGGAQPEREAVSIAGPLRAVIALGLFLLYLLAAAAFSNDVRSGFFSRLSPLCGKPLVFSAAPLALLLLAFLEALLLFGLAAFFEPAYGANAALESAALLLYLLYLTALALLLSGILRLGRTLYAALPVLLLASLLLMPVFIDLSRFAPVLYRLSLFLPPALYFRAAEGSVPALLFMMGLTGIFAALSHQILARKQVSIK